MIENDTKKVYIVNNLKSDNIEQVIFILRENSTTKKNLHSDSDIALEAERIINSYANKIRKASNIYSKTGTKRKTKKKFSAAVGFILAAAVILLITSLIINNYFLF